MNGGKKNLHFTHMHSKSLSTELAYNTVCLPQVSECYIHIPNPTESPFKPAITFFLLGSLCPDLNPSSFTLAPGLAEKTPPIFSALEVVPDLPHR